MPEAVSEAKGWGSGPHNLSLVLALPPLPRQLLVARSGLARGETRLDPLQIAKALQINSEQARVGLLEAFAGLREAPLVRPLLHDPLYGYLLRGCYGAQAQLAPLDAELNQFLAALPPRERMVALLRSGAGAIGAHTPQETAELLGSSPEIVQQFVEHVLRISPSGIWGRLMESIFGDDPSRYNPPGLGRRLKPS